MFEKRAPPKATACLSRRPARPIRLWRRPRIRRVWVGRARRSRETNTASCCPRSLFPNPSNNVIRPPLTSRFVSFSSATRHGTRLVHGGRSLRRWTGNSGSVREKRHSFWNDCGHGLQGRGWIQPAKPVQSGVKDSSSSSGLGSGHRTEAFGRKRPGSVVFWNGEQRLWLGRRSCPTWRFQGRRGFGRRSIRNIRGKVLI